MCAQLNININKLERTLNSREILLETTRKLYFPQKIREKKSFGNMQKSLHNFWLEVFCFCFKINFLIGKRIKGVLVFPLAIEVLFCKW